MSRFEYDVIQLKVQTDTNDRRTFKWMSCKNNCHDMAFSDLEGMLNRVGQQGWKVVSHDTDAAYGSYLILMREKVEEAPATPATGGKKSRTVVINDPKTVEAADAIRYEVQKLGEAIANQAAPERTIALTDPALLAAIREMAERIPAPSGPAVATLDPTALAALTKLADRELPALFASLDGEAIARLEAALVSALGSHAPTATLDATAVQALTESIRAMRPEPPQGPALAMIAPEALHQLAASITSALPVPVASAPVRATLDPAALELLRPQITPETFARLEEAIRCAMARPIQPSIAVLEEGAELRIAAAIGNLPVPQVTTELDVPALRAAFLEAVTAMPRPEVQALPTTLSAEALSALITAMERVIAKIPVPASPVVRATLDEASVTRLERAITNAVAVALLPKEEPVPAPKPIWNRIVAKLGLAAS